MKKNIEYLKKYLDKEKIDDGIKKLESGIPVQYIIGNVDFYGNIIEVDDRVLIPRFETELLVDKTINYIYNFFDDVEKLKILDIGTGSGCIAISLKKNLKCEVNAVDVSSDALEVATKNAIDNEVKINFVLSNIFENISDKFDVIISNPPYIKFDEEIEDIVLKNEPNIALFADNDGLYFYEEILKNVSSYLKKKFLIAFEIGYMQGDCVKNLVYKYLKNVNVFVERDYSNRDRFVFVISK